MSNYRIAVLCGVTGLLMLGAGCQAVQPKQQRNGFTAPLDQANISVTETGSSYLAAKPAATLTSDNISNSADILLAGIDFNNAGDGLLFNHPGGIATDGTRLLMADKNNNRVLIWNSLPSGNTAPDIVLGQPNMTNNNPGTVRNAMNWPTAVTVVNDKVMVADTNNNRILIWNSFPTNNGQAADLILAGDAKADVSQRGNISWPWGVWSNGEKLVVSSTKGGQIFIWNTLPTSDNQKPDITIKLDDIGTPRNIISDGNTLAVGDHNAFENQRGTFFWSNFPTADDAMYDFFMATPALTDNTNSTNQPQNPQLLGEEMTGGSYTEDGKFVTVTNSGLFIWNTFPTDQNDSPDVSIAQDTFTWKTGDGAGVAIASESMYVSQPNGNNIVGFNAWPTEPIKPDFTVGSPNISTNTLETNYFITNPVPATDGKHLFVSSDFDRKVYVWKQLPNSTDAKPDLVYNAVTGWDNALYGDTFVVAGGSNLYVWDTLPVDGNLPTQYSGQVGSITVADIKGVALDDKYFYLADASANKIYIWNDVPKADVAPVIELPVETPHRLSSDGQYLAVSTDRRGSFIMLYDVNDLTKEPIIIGDAQEYNLPMNVLIADNHLFIADTGFNRVLMWDNVADALAGSDADVVLGNNADRNIGEIGRDKLFMPAALAFDGSYLWVGEFKFSGRLLRFSAD